MDFRSVGGSGLRVSVAGLGCNNFGGRIDADATRAVVDAALDVGITLFDTADIYGSHRSEELLGAALGARRDEVVLATKFAMPMGDGPYAAGGSRRYVMRAVEASLRRLGTDHIDLYQLHSPPRSVIEHGDYVGALNALVDQGKIRHFGIAADAVADVVDGPFQPAVESLQVPFSLLHQEGAIELFPAAADRGIGVIARSCYAAGLFKDGLAPDMLRELTPDAERILSLHAKADELGRPLLELALQFSLATAPIAVTILGMRTRAQLSDNLRCYASPALSGAELAVLRESPREVR
jgi:aryl-alcohol dehydrogenase-like predicted oxidoreductase